MSDERENVPYGRILVVSNISTNVQHFANILAPHGYQVSSVQDGQAALVQLPSLRPNLILLDSYLPDINGYEVCKRLKAMDEYQHIPVIFIHSMDEMANKTQGFEAGGTDYITEPFDPHEILTRVQVHFSPSEIRRQLESQKLSYQREVYERQRVETELLQSNELLEMKIQERTAEILQVNQALKNELIERQKAEQALLESEKRYRNVVESSPLGMHFYTLENDDRLIFTGANSAANEILGVDNRQFIGKTLEEAFPALAESEIPSAYRLVARNGVPWHADQVLYSEGEIHGAYEVHVFQTSPGKISATFLDITERKQAEQALGESEKRFRLLVKNMPILISAFDNQFNFAFWNQECEKVTGYRAEEILSNPQALQLLYPDVEYREQLLAEWAERGNSFVNRETTLTSIDGSQRIISWTSFSDQFPVPGWASWSIGIDITERSQATAEREHLLERVREQARQVGEIMDTVPEGVLLLNTKGDVIQANSVAQEILHLLAKWSQEGSLTHLGNRQLAELLTPPPKGLWHEVSSPPNIFEVIARPMADTAEPERWVLVLNDVTREREIQRGIQQQERLASVGQLAAGIAHDFNNILAVIILYTDMILGDPVLDSRMYERISTISDQAKRASMMIQQILDFSRRAVLERQQLNVLPLLKEQYKLLERTLPENIRISFNYEPGDYIVNVDPTRLQQAIMNLAVNARDAMPEGGELQIHLSKPGKNDSIGCISCGKALAGEWVSISITDSGKGIQPDAIPHIFEPFFTTKAPGQGTGLGLSQVYGIIKQHDGHVEVSSSFGKGATFRIHLPDISTPLADPMKMQPAALVIGKKQHILIVEDEPATQQALIDSLTLLNYKVTAVTDGLQALEFLKQNRDQIDLILSDVVMPQLGGIALFRSLSANQLAIPMVLITGHPMRGELEELQAEGLAGWLLKPPQLRQLSQLIADILS